VWPSLRLVIEYPLDIVLSGIRSFMPRVYVGVSEIEIGKDYPAKIRLSRSIPPRERPEGSVIALYMLLYPLAESGPVVKLGTVSMYSSESAAMIWAQAPVYTSVVGVFHLTKTISLENLEQKGRRILLKHGYASTFRFVTKRSKEFDSRKIVKMWMRSRPSWGDLKKLIDELEGAAEFLLRKMLESIDYIELLYTGTGFEASQQYVDLPQNFEMLKSLLKKMTNTGRRSVKGLLRVTPIGLCMFTSTEGVESNDQSTPYIDLCREFAYNVKMSLIHENKDENV